MRQGQRIRDLEARIAESEALLAEQDRELQALRSKTRADVVQVGYDASSVHSTSVSLSPEAEADWAAVNGFRIHRLTSGLTSTEAPVFHLVLQPLDSDGELRKVAGQVEVSITWLKPGEQPIGLAVERVSVTESRRAWTRGLVSSGYHLDIDLDQSLWNREAVGSRKIAVAASLSLGGDRVYTSSEVFNIVVD